MTVKLRIEHHLGFESLKGGCIGWSGSTFVKMPHCWKSNVGLMCMCARKVTYLIRLNQHDNAQLNSGNLLLP